MTTVTPTPSFFVMLFSDNKVSAPNVLCKINADDFVSFDLFRKGVCLKLQQESGITERDVKVLLAICRNRVEYQFSYEVMDDPGLFIVRFGGDRKAIQSEEKETQVFFPTPERKAQLSIHTLGTEGVRYSNSPDDPILKVFLAGERIRKLSFGSRTYEVIKDNVVQKTVNYVWSWFQGLNEETQEDYKCLDG